ncbi:MULTISPECIES: hypothetical protein [Georgenia]|uniref:Uncharacterized protein n=1 Tax=Georgenia muralis TaxID=154117 RepID=A0A3N4Z620_9MICO|nr:hypothetical protein [Georgenia muralis]RPF26590.1 hypothetical protein EDD32_1037 [Georgenia muralis]
MIKKLGASVLLAAALVGVSVAPATAASDGAMRTMCVMCWPTPGAK